MLLIYLGVYTFILLIIWGFFIVAKIHSYKFKNFSHNIEKFTIILFIFLLILSLVGYVLIFFLDTSKASVDLTKRKDFSNLEETYY